MAVDYRARIEKPYGVGYAGRARDLSVSGVFVEMRGDSPVRGLVTCVLAIPDPPKRGKLTLSGYVVRQDPQGIGIRWDEASSRLVSARLGA